MSKLQEVFENKIHKSLFVPYFSLGDPNYSLSIEWGKSILDAGADILELGIPFSDPIADGPVIQKSYKRALDNEVFSFEKIFFTTEKIHSHNPNIPIIYLTYLNPIIQYGLEKFFDKAHSVGVAGIVIPDLPFDTVDYKNIYKISQALEIDLINLITPSTTKSRMKEMKQYASGFIYYVTSFGVTGERKALSKDLSSRIQKVKEIMKIPVCAGFGISTPEQAEEISHFADGVIIGSAIQKIIEENYKNPDYCKYLLYNFINSIRKKML